MWIIFLLAEYPEVELGLTHTTAETLRSHVEGLVGDLLDLCPYLMNFWLNLSRLCWVSCDFSARNLNRQVKF